MAFKIKKGLKKIRGMVELESPEEFRQDYRRLEKHPVSFAWDMQLDDPKVTKKTFKGIKDDDKDKGWGGKIEKGFEDLKKLGREMREELLTKKKTKKEKGFWK